MSDIKNSLIEYQLFPRRYFSGSDAYVIIGNKVVDEIKSIEFEVQQQVSHLYGYASYTADATVYGARTVMGKFSINFRETGYLLSLLDAAYDEAAPVGTEPFSGVSKDPEYIAGLVKNGSFDKLKEAMEYQEDLIWGKEIDLGYRPYCEPKFIPRNDTSMRYNGFDIVISYGDEGFHIGDTIGEIPSTVEVINGVSIVSMNKRIEPTGDAIYEEYTFIAKDYNNPIGSRKESFPSQTETVKT